MLKSISNLKTVHSLTKKQKKQINGGCPVPSCWVVCPDYAAIVCGINTGLYPPGCDCNC